MEVVESVHGMKDMLQPVQTSQEGPRSVTDVQMILFALLRVNMKAAPPIVYFLQYPDFICLDSVLLFDFEMSDDI